jgi:hypothetical protein
MKTIDIKGKPYVTVNERLKYFREQDAFKGWRLETTILNADSDICLMKAEILNEEGHVMSTGHAYEEAGSTFINKTSHVENCETSAVGRALGNLGIGIDESVASFDEVATAVTNQQTKDERPWLNQSTFNEAVKGMNTMSEKSEREEAYNFLDKKYRMKRDYRNQLKEIVEQVDIPGLV